MTGFPVLKSLKLNLSMKAIACECVFPRVFLCVLLCLLVFVCVFRVWLSCWHGVTTLAQKRTQMKQVEQQALFSSKFCMSVNVNLMNKQKGNKAFPGLFLKFIRMENVHTSQWGMSTEAWVIPPSSGRLLRVSNWMKSEKKEEEEQVREGEDAGGVRGSKVRETKPGLVPPVPGQGVYINGWGHVSGQGELILTPRAAGHFQPTGRLGLSSTRQRTTGLFS